MSKPAKAAALPLLAHCLVVAVASLLLAFSAAGSLTFLPTTRLDPTISQRAVQISLLPAGASVKVGSRNALDIRMDTQGQVPQQVSLILDFPADSMAIGSITSPQTSCERSLRILRQNGEIMLGCDLEKAAHPVQLVDLFSVAYVPTVPGTATLRLDDAQSSASGPAGTLRISSRQASLTIIP